MTGRTIGSAGAHGKYLLFQLSGDWVLVVHLRMTGLSCIIAPPTRPQPVHRESYFILWAAMPWSTTTRERSALCTCCGKMN